MRRLRYVTQHTLPIVYKGRTLDTSYRVDLIVEDWVVVEVKSRGEANGRGEARRQSTPVDPCLRFSVVIRSLRPLHCLPLTSALLRELRSFSPIALAAP